MNTNNLESETPEGEQWIITKHTKVLHRKTFIKGKLVSKYYGELDDVKDAYGYVKERYFDFTFYEAEIKESVFRMNNDGKFPEFKSSEIFPGIIQPSPLPCKIKYNNIEGDFEIVLYDLVLANIDFNKHRALHQEEDNQIFGTVEADVTGYLLEKFIEKFETKILRPITYDLPPNKEPISKPNESNSGDGREESIPPFPISEPIVNPLLPYYPTGRKEIKGDYIYDEETDGSLFRLVNPTYIGKKETGCFESFWQLIGLVMALLFLIAIGPQGILGLLIVTAFVSFIVYFSLIIKWLIRIAAVLMLAFAVFSFIIALQNNKPFIPTPLVKDEKRETDTAVKDKSNPSDSLIIHHRIWKDYDGTQYEGNIWVKLSDYKSSGYYKHNLYVQSNTMDVYDKMLFDLKNQDSSKLYGVYKMLDSIRLSNNQSEIRFAETVVSFIQDIPYAIVLDNACYANLYNDQFTKKYLENNGDCDGYQRFGINSPVEFMANLKGDCDTRTLLLYTMFSHYHYDVALLSSELYSHSILAINLPITGKYIIGNGKKYVVWETTSGVKPGLLPEEMSDFNNWRISLISKP